MCSKKEDQNNSNIEYIVYHKKFTRRVEDFMCEICGTHVLGTGYTNHCPNCLYSKHVDVNPGDRDSLCKGIMAPIKQGYQKKKGVFIVHECLRCGYQKKNKISERDNNKIIDKLPL